MNNILNTGISLSGLSCFKMPQFSKTSKLFGNIKKHILLIMCGECINVIHGEQGSDTIHPLVPSVAFIGVRKSVSCGIKTWHALGLFEGRHSLYSMHPRQRNSISLCLTVCLPRTSS